MRVMELAVITESALRTAQVSLCMTYSRPLNRVITVQNVRYNRTNAFMRLSPLFHEKFKLSSTA